MGVKICGGDTDDLYEAVTLTDQALHETETYSAEASRKIES